MEENTTYDDNFNFGVKIHSLRSYTGCLLEILARGKAGVLRDITFKNILLIHWKAQL